MRQSQLNRRHLLTSLCIGAIAPPLFGKFASAAPIAVTKISLKDYSIDFDASLRMRILKAGNSKTLAIVATSQSDKIVTELSEISNFQFIDANSSIFRTQYGDAKIIKIRAQSQTGLSLVKEIIIPNSRPNMAIIRTILHNNSNNKIGIKSARINDLMLNGNGAGFWSYSGATHQDRRDWVQLVKPDFRQENFMGMNASDYGGGCPIIDVWRNDVGIAIGHLEMVPKLVKFPIISSRSGVSMAMEYENSKTLQVGESFELPETFINLHKGDFFNSLVNYRELMSAKGIKPAKFTESCYEPIWCAWGYERNFTTEEVVATLPKARELGLKWAVLDDGWQTSEGDWKLDKTKFPNGEADMKAFVAAIKAQGLRPRLWIAPLAIDPGTDLMHDHTDMLLLNENGEPQLISWWNSFYACPAYQPTIDYFKSLVTKIIGDWGFEGLKIDGQHLNGVAPCSNPAHKHKYPEESVEKLQDFWKVIYDTAMALNPNAVVEICPCGTSYSYFNMPYLNQAPASDPTSSWQVRLKGKALKALMGANAAYAGDHVELSDGGDDFASSVGIGAIVSTKFTLPETKTKKEGDSRLNPQKEQKWRKWIGIYNKYQLPKGEYLGELYDIGFEKPEAHVVRKDGALFYGFYAKNWRGPINFKGLEVGEYQIYDYVNDKVLGRVNAANPKLNIDFDGNLLVKLVRGA